MKQSAESIGFRGFVYLTLCAASFCVPWLFPALRNYSSGAAVVAGLLFAVVWGNPFLRRTSRLTSPMLGTAIVLMGFGLNLRQVLQMGGQGLGYTLSGIVMAFAVGLWVGRRLGLEHDCCLLICSGTAICGGSAIAAVAPVLRAKAHHVAIATSVVFVLNAVALLIFPVIGHSMGLSQEQFGLWAAVAIHDTSSVVGASLQYGDRALAVGTTVKLARALWIVPVALVISLVNGRKSLDGGRAKISVPWFIPAFLLAAGLVAWLPALQPAGKKLADLSKYLMVMTLFVIGSNVSLDKLRETGLKPVIHGVVLWLFLLTVWLVAISRHWVSG